MKIVVIIFSMETHADSTLIGSVLMLYCQKSRIPEEIND